MALVSLIWNSGPCPPTNIYSRREEAEVFIGSLTIADEKQRLVLARQARGRMRTDECGANVALELGYSSALRDTVLSRLAILEDITSVSLPQSALHVKAQPTEGIDAMLLEECDGNGEASVESTAAQEGKSEPGSYVAVKVKEEQTSSKEVTEFRKSKDQQEEKGETEKRQGEGVYSSSSIGWNHVPAIKDSLQFSMDDLGRRLPLALSMLDELFAWQLHQWEADNTRRNVYESVVNDMVRALSLSLHTILHTLASSYIDTLIHSISHPVKF